MAESEHIIEEILKINPQIGDVLIEKNICKDEEFCKLSYGSFKETIENNNLNAVETYKIWKIIRDLKPQVAVTPPRDSYSDMSSDIYLQHEFVKPQPVKASSCNLNTSPVDLLKTSVLGTPSPSGENKENLADDKSIETPSSSNQEAPHHVVLKSPRYTVYMDSDLKAARDNLPKELRHRLIRATISGMTSIAFSEANRMPTNYEVEEMAKSLCHVYPSLKTECGNHFQLKKQLVKRLYNTKMPSNIQITSRKSRLSVPPQPKVPKLDDTELIPSQPTLTEDDTDSIDNDTPISTDSEPDDSLLNDDAVIKRHVNSLAKELKKKKPNTKIVNYYMNKTFDARRETIDNMEPDKRAALVIQQFSGFKDSIEIIEELRRIIKGQSQDHMEFTLRMCKKLEDELDTLIWYGLSRNELKAPASGKVDSKMVFLMMNLAGIFMEEKKKKKTGKDVVFLEIQDHEDPDELTKKMSSSSPVLLIDSEQIILLIGKCIYCHMDRKDIVQAFITYLAAFYLLNMDYPKSLEVPCYVLQMLLFNDNQSPVDCLAAVNEAYSAYEHYKKEN